MNDDEITIGIKVKMPEKMAKAMANEMQHVFDRFGCETVLKAMDFLKKNPQYVNMGLNAIRGHRIGG